MSDTTAHQFDTENTTLKIKYDSDSQNPREWDNLTKMICFHKRYNLGDKHDYNFDYYSSFDEMKKEIIENEGVAIIEPLYMYDHSGQTISTKPFSCPWDSGQIGFVFITKKDLLEEFGGKRITKKIIERGERVLRGEVETYDQFIRGDVYGFEIEYKTTDSVSGEIKDDVSDSCWGFYGDNIWKNGMYEHINSDAIEDLRELLEAEFGKQPQN